MASVADIFNCCRLAEWLEACGDPKGVTYTASLRALVDAHDAMLAVLETIIEVDVNRDGGPTDAYWIARGAIAQAKEARR